VLYGGGVDQQLAVAIAAAAGLGAVVGLERQLGRDPGGAYAGARTFALYGAWGAAAGWLGDRFGVAAFAVLAAAFLGLVVASYLVGAKSDPGTTTEAAAVIVFVVGTFAWAGEWTAAVAVAVGTAALLRAKEFLHSLSERFSDDDVQAVLQFAVITAVILPLVPNEDLGPLRAFNPFETWLMVVFVSAIGLVGYIGIRLLGERGLGVTGFAGGVVSSTAVTLGFSRLSRSHPHLRSVLAAGILGASAIMYPRVLIEAQVVSPPLAERLAIPLLVLGAGMLVVAGAWLVRPSGPPPSEGAPTFRNPLTLTTALQFGALYAAIVFLAALLTDNVSEGSLVLLGAASGITDVDAITLSTANLVEDGLDAQLASRVVLAAVTVNTAVKAALVALLGSRRLLVAAGVGLVVATGGGLVATLLM
jgi:uncharacterized membrane protein (DUF4010 family)